MFIKLNKKRDSTHKDPLVVMLKRKGKPTFTHTIEIGEAIEVDDELGFAIMGDERYNGLFEQTDKAHPAPPQKSAAAPKNKSASAEATK